jgi:predicted DNA-binding transcriptional regulator YafY
MVLGVVREAISNRKVVRIVYESRYHGRPEVTTREIEPLGEAAGRIEAYCRLRQDLRYFRLDRIRSAAFTGAFFNPRPTTSPWSRRPQHSLRARYQSLPADPDKHESNAGCIWSIVILLVLLWLLSSL